MNHSQPTPLVALTHVVPDTFAQAAVTHIQRRPISLDRARAQHREYQACLTACGVECRELTVNKHLPDGVFIEDAAVILKDIAILTAMGLRSRMAEPGNLAPILQEYRPVVRIEPPGTLEGGDVLRVGTRVFVGRSTRTNDEGIEQLIAAVRRFGLTVDVIDVVGALHLKTAFCAIDEDRALVNREWLSFRGGRQLEIMDVPEDEPWGANLIRVGNRVILSDKHRRTADRLERLGKTVHRVDISEFEKAEGGVTCLSLLVGDPSSSEG